MYLASSVYCLRLCAVSASYPILDSQPRQCADISERHAGAMPRTWTAVPEIARVPAETAVPEQRWHGDGAATGRGSGKAGSEVPRIDGTQDWGSFVAGLEICKYTSQRGMDTFFCPLQVSKQWCCYSLPMRHRFWYYCRFCQALETLTQTVLGCSGSRVPGRGKECVQHRGSGSLPYPKVLLSSCHQLEIVRGRRGKWQ